MSKKSVSVPLTRYQVFKVDRIGGAAALRELVEVDAIDPVDDPVLVTEHPLSFPCRVRLSLDKQVVEAIKPLGGVAHIRRLLDRVQLSAQDERTIQVRLSAEGGEPEWVSTGPGRPSRDGHCGTKATAVMLTDAHREKLKLLGGSVWVRAAIDAAEVP